FPLHASPMRKSKREESGATEAPSGGMTAFPAKLSKKETKRLAAALRFLAKSGVDILGLGILTSCALLLHWDLATIAPLYFLWIVLAALKWGFWQATVISAVAVVCECYFFIPPAFSFDVADTRSYVSLIVFELSALLVSRLSASEQTNARDAEIQ